VTDALVEDAASCTAMVHAELLADWVGAGRPVTPKGVLRPADIPAVAAALGVEVPARNRSAADVWGIHRPWVAALAIGRIIVDANRATAVAAPSTDPLEAWWTAFSAVLAEESHDRRDEGGAVLCRTLLTALVREPQPSPERLDELVHELLHDMDFEQSSAVYQAFRRGVMPVDGGLEVLVEFGAVDSAARLTALGRWARDRFAEATPEPVTPDLSAADLLMRLAGLPEQDAWQEGRRWLRGHDPVRAVAAVLDAAETATPAARIAGIDLVGGLGEAARPAWEAVLDRPMLAPHARAVLATWDVSESEPEPTDADRQWLAVEYALAVDDPEEAYHLVQDFGGMAILDASSHPGAAGLRDALTAAGRPPQRMYQLKIALTRYRPAVWRRLCLPATTTLDVLHHMIKTAFEWHDDHLHLFEAGRRQYADPFFDLEECDDESAVRLSKVLPREGATMSYVYDLGDYWEHRITLEKIDEIKDEDCVPVIVCTGGRGDAPIEDWNPEDGPATTPFDLWAINHRLATLYGEPVR
jgi:Plasmid pRiA4b ORF-3-like protein